MKVLVVDDEPLARAELRRLVAAVSGAVVVGECATALEAERALLASTPDVMLLDIEMPGGTGFDLLERVPTLPAVIFTTAYDQHALRAFEVGAIDYLLKPIELGRLRAALARVTPRTRPRLFVRDGARCWLVPLDEVRSVTTDGNYVRLSWGERELLFARSLAALERHLDDGVFVRANRATLVNLAWVERITPRLGGRLELHLRGGTSASHAVIVSRRQAQALRSKLGW